MQNIPDELKELKQWCVWTLKVRDGKPTKVPFHPCGAPAKSNDKATWSTYSSALAAYQTGNYSGLGLFIAGTLCGIDLDHCIDASGATPAAAEILMQFAGTYCEVSPSGTGYRIFCYGQPGRSGKGNNPYQWVECYAAGSPRYLTVTGNAVGAAAVTEQQAALDWLHATYFRKPIHKRPPPCVNPSLDDEQLLDKARQARNGAIFDALWRGDTSHQGGDESAADMALCGLLAFWTGGDASAVDRLFRQSGLMRDKWDTRRGETTYGAMTVDKAIAGCGDFYSARNPGGHAGEHRGRANATAPDQGGAAPAQPKPDDDLARRFQTDLGNSERLVARYGRDLRFCFDFGKWLVWDGIRWAIDRNGAALDKAKETARAMLAEAATLADREDARKLAAWSFRSQARERMAAMLYLAQPDVSVRPEQLDTHPWMLNVLNGTLDLRTGTLRKAARDDLLTKAAPVAYDPSARCEQWLSFLNRIFDGNIELIRYVQKAAGYSLTGLDTEECFFVLWGVGANGKSTFVETLAALLGADYAQQATPDLLMQKKQDRHATELAVLRGARMVASVETGQGKRLNEALIKSMTGGDRIRANFMHQDTFEFRPEFKVWLSTNHKPVITGTDLGIWRRIRLIPFNVKIPDDERDGAFKTRLREPGALSGILNWALEGVLLWQREGLKSPQPVVNAIQAYREEMDVLAAWISDCCVVTKLAEASAAELYRSYVQWREDSGERPETQTSFGLRLTERGFDRVKRRNGWVWYGIGLLSCDPCDPCDPKSDIKEGNFGEHIDNVENRVTPVTPVTEDAGTWGDF